jgi:glutamyl-Q tRNA(Asp) synthetase
MEDLDLPRVQPGSARGILNILESFGFEWDGEVLYQSTRTDRYREMFESLRSAGHVFGCGCARRDLPENQPYPGTCRSGPGPARSARAWRVRVNSTLIEFDDRVQGFQSQDVERYCGDFVILRADCLFAYQLAVVVDDSDQGVTDVVRGADLLDSTPRQIYLQRLLGAPSPRYLHTPVAVNSLGQKLSKQTLAPAITAENAAVTLIEALCFLGQDPPPELREAGLNGIWRWAVANWRPDRIPTAEVSPAPLCFSY